MLSRYCHRCRAVKPANHRHRVKDTRPSASERGYDHKWRNTRRQFKAAFPICQWHEGCLKPTAHVHHLDGQGPNGPKGHDWGNLQALCGPHHSQITAAEKPGGWNQGVGDNPQRDS